MRFSPYVASFPVGRSSPEALGAWGAAYIEWGILVSRFSCPDLQGEVELTEERERHIAERHPDLLPEHRERIAETLADPDQIQKECLVWQRQVIFSMVH